MFTQKVTKIGVLTSGGDAPGMNAAIRAVVRTALAYNLEVYGIHHGYAGIMQGNDESITKMDNRSVGNIIHRGGTILKTARCLEFKEPAGRVQAYENLKKYGIDGLVVIGGDGSFKGAQLLSNEHNIPCIGLPGTIDNDIAGTDYTIGFDTAVNTAVEAIDKIRDTADAHDRVFVIEVMGRDAGYIAVYSGITTGAEEILIPETKTNIELLVEHLSKEEKRKKLMNIIIVAEGCKIGGGNEIGKIIKTYLPKLDVRVCILGHIQRGGSPSAADRLLATQMGYYSVNALIEGKRNVMVGVVNKKITYTPLDKAVKEKPELDMEWMRMGEILAK